MPSALIIGGSGQIGLAVATALAHRDWDIRLGSRTPPPVSGPWRHVVLDRAVSGALTKALGEGADLLMDCISMDAAHAEELLSVQDAVGRIVATSSASVYRDLEARTLDEARETGFPDFPVPIDEDQRTVMPGPETYSTRKVAMEQTLLMHAHIPVTILRPCAIHGPYSKHAREWWFVKRLLDGRRRIPLAYGGRSRFQTTSTKAIADAAHYALNDHAPPVLNVVDADAPSVAEIGRAIMAVMDCKAELIGLPDEPIRHLWGLPLGLSNALWCAHHPRLQPALMLIPYPERWNGFGRRSAIAIGRTFCPSWQPIHETTLTMTPTTMRCPRRRLGKSGLFSFVREDLSQSSDGNLLVFIPCNLSSRMNECAVRLNGSVQI